MRENYKLNGPLTNLNVQLEAEMVETLQVMEKHVNIPVAELVNTAIKRYISAHNDFLPNEFREERRRRRNATAYGNKQ
jgi:hypothetical protein